MDMFHSYVNVYQRVNNVSCEAAGDMKKQTKTYYGGGPGSLPDPKDPKSSKRLNSHRIFKNTQALRLTIFNR